MILATAQEVRARLRMDATDPDAGFVDLCTAAANDLVTFRLYGDTPPDPDPWPAPPSLLQRATVGVAIRIYRFKDAEADVSDTWNGGTTPLRIPRDPLAGYDHQIAYYVHAWGVA